MSLTKCKEPWLPVGDHGSYKPDFDQIGVSGGLSLQENLQLSNLRQKLHRGLDRVEGGVGLAADGLDRRQADDDDQGQHDGVFNSGGAVFRNDELLDAGDE
jgi:hypothetical protein